MNTIHFSTTIRLTMVMSILSINGLGLGMEEGPVAPDVRIDHDGHIRYEVLDKVSFSELKSEIRDKKVGQKIIDTINRAGSYLKNKGCKIANTSMSWVKNKKDAMIARLKGEPKKTSEEPKEEKKQPEQPKSHEKSNESGQPHHSQQPQGETNSKPGGLREKEPAEATENEGISSTAWSLPTTAELKVMMGTAGEACLGFVGVAATCYITFNLLRWAKNKAKNKFKKNDDEWEEEE